MSPLKKISDHSLSSNPSSSETSMNPHHPSPPVPVHSLKFKWKKGKSERQEWVSSPAEPVHGHTRDLDRELIIFKQECNAERLSEELIRVSPHTLSQRWAIPITLKMKDQVHLFGQCFHWLRFWSELSAEIHFPSRDKCSEKAYAVNGAPLQIPHMVWNVHVCRNRVCPNLHFVLLRDNEHDCLLGTTFLSALEKFRILNDEKG